MAEQLLSRAVVTLGRRPGCRWVLAASDGAGVLFSNRGRRAAVEFVSGKHLHGLCRSQGGLKLFPATDEKFAGLAHEVARVLAAHRARPCRVAVVAGNRPPLTLWLACGRKKPRADCRNGPTRAALAPVANCLLGGARLREGKVTFALLTRVLEEIDCAALVCDGREIPLWANRAALAMGEKAGCFSGSKWLTDGAWKVLTFRVERRSFRLAIARNGATAPAHAHRSDWATRLGLEPRHAKVGALLIRGLTDKEIAQQLGLSHQTVRTYVKELFRHTGCTTRHGFVGGVLGGMK